MNKIPFEEARKIPGAGPQPITIQTLYSKFQKKKQKEEGVIVKPKYPEHKNKKGIENDIRSEIVNLYYLAGIPGQDLKTTKTFIKQISQKKKELRKFRKHRARECKTFKAEEQSKQENINQHREGKADTAKFDELFHKAVAHAQNFLIEPKDYLPDKEQKESA